MTLIRSLGVIAQRLPGRRVFITGAAFGLGAQLARELGRFGFRLGLNDIDETSLNELARELRDGGAEVRTYPFDVADAAAFARAAGAYEQALGGADLVINAAGIGGAGPLESYRADWAQRVMDVNFQGSYLGSRAFLSGMLARRRGHIVNIASAAAYHALPDLSVYSASKAAVVTASETLAAECHSRGVQVSVMVCAFYRSDIWRHTLGDAEQRWKARKLGDITSLRIERVAEATLRGVADGRFYIVLGGQARFVWYAKRWAPGLWLRVAPWLADQIGRRVGPNPEKRPV